MTVPLLRDLPGRGIVMLTPEEARAAYGVPLLYQHSSEPPFRPLRIVADPNPMPRVRLFAWSRRRAT